MAVAPEVTRFVSCARALAPGPAAQFRMLWALSKNARVAARIAKHHPDAVYSLSTRLGDVYLRDNFGDVTNLPGLLVENSYRVTKLDRPGDVLDVGANIGLFAKWIAAHNPDRRVHCFEPLASNVRLVRLNCPAAVVNTVGVGSVRGVVTAGVDRHSAMVSSVDQPWALDPIEFDVIPLDEYVAANGIREVAFFKLDTEGMELEVLEGAKRTLEITRAVAMETHGQARHVASIERLQAAGFRIDAEERHDAVGMVWASRP